MKDEKRESKGHERSESRATEAREDSGKATVSFPQGAVPRMKIPAQPHNPGRRNRSYTPQKVKGC